LLLTDDAGIRELNNDYRHKDTATDVLSFPLLEPDDLIVPGCALGDIVISTETMQRQATEFGHSLEREGVFLFVHGLLHLLGYDHELGLAEEALMEARQNEVLELLDLPRK